MEEEIQKHVELISETDLGDFEEKINKALDAMHKDGAEVVDIKFTDSKDRYTAMVIYTW